MFVDAALCLSVIFHSETTKVGVFHFFFLQQRVCTEFGRYFTRHFKTAYIAGTPLMLLTIHFCLHLLQLNAIVSELYWNKGGNNTEPCEWERVQRAAAAQRPVRARILRPFVDGAAPHANWQILFHFLLFFFE